MRTCKDNAAALGGGQRREDTRGSSNTAKRTGGRPEVQGNRTGRNACQPAPTWPRPAGADAADELLRALASWTALLGRQPVDPTRGRQ